MAALSRAQLRVAWATVGLVAVAGLAACSPPGQQTSNLPGTTPPVFTGAPEPASPETPGNAAQGATLQTTLHDSSGSTVGDAQFTDMGNYVRLTVNVHGLTPGVHGLEIAEFARCDPNSVGPVGGPSGDFLSAGGSIQAGGGLAPVQVRNDGNGELVTTTDAFTVKDLRAGRSIVVDAGPGSGDSGNGAIPTASGPNANSRVACGVISSA